MKLIKAVTVTDAMIVSCNVAENDYAAWSGATTYPLAGRCINTTTHKIYESVQAANLNHDPTTDDGTWWIEVSATNRWKMLDDSTGSQTTNATSVSITLEPLAVVNSIALLNVDAASVQIIMTDPIDGEVYNQTYSLTLGSTIGDWDDYFFDYIERTDVLVVSDLPHYVNAEIQIIASVISGNASVGVLRLGRAIELGGVQAGVTTGITDYSRKEADVFGGYTLLQRAYSKRAAFDLIIPTEILTQVSNLLAEMRATPVVWIGSDDYSPLVIFGFYKDFDIVISYPTHSTCRLEIEGMT